MTARPQTMGSRCQGSKRPMNASARNRYSHNARPVQRTQCAEFDTRVILCNEVSAGEDSPYGSFDRFVEGLSDAWPRRKATR